MHRSEVKMKGSQKTLAFWALMIVIGFVLVQMYQQQEKNIVKQYDLTQFRKDLEAGRIDSVVTINSETSHISGHLKPETKDAKALEFSIEFDPKDPKFYTELHQNGISYNVESNRENSYILAFLINWLPALVIFFLFLFLMKQISVGGGKAMSFGKSRAKLLTENKNKVMFKDVAGVEEAKSDLQEIVQFLKDPKKFTRLGGKIPKGVLLVGPPGTGKTLLARAVAGEAGVPFFTISGSDFVEMFVGVGASRVRDLFEQGKKNAPCLIFIDEIDAVGRHRGAGMGGGHDEREQTLNQMLVEMDGFESNEGVILIAATNRPDVLDPALLRPGRFDRRVVVNKPDINGRELILDVHTRKVPLASDVDLKKIARGTPGFAGADLANLVNEAAITAAKHDSSKVTMADFEFAKDKVMMGSERKSMVITDEDRKITAYHEAGHALVGKFLKGTDPIHKVTIIPRGMALGLTQFLPENENLNLSKRKAENLIAMMFGGRIAEEVIFEDFTTGASNDIERATDIARRMVCEWGMSETMGPLAYEKNNGPVFLGLQSGQNIREYSDAKAEEIDNEIRRIIFEGYGRAKRIITENIGILHKIAEALLEFETVDGDDINLLATGGDLSGLKQRYGEKQAAMAREQEEGRKELEKKTFEEEKEKAASRPLGDPVTA